MFSAGTNVVAAWQCEIQKPLGVADRIAKQAAKSWQFIVRRRTVDINAEAPLEKSKSLCRIVPPEIIPPNSGYGKDFKRPFAFADSPKLAHTPRRPAGKLRVRGRRFENRRRI
jgi:hypothetical protein